jgi:hypothetical protein
MTAPDSLKLNASDAEDLAVIAACTQDALVPIGDMAYLPAEQRFVLAVNRFRWDQLKAGEIDRKGEPESRGDAAFIEEAGGGGRYERVLSGLRFEQVTAVRTHGIDLRNRERILELLTIRSEPGAVLLVFAGGAMIRIEVAALQCYLEDFGDAWPTRWRPRHPESESGGERR